MATTNIRNSLDSKHIALVLWGAIIATTNIMNSVNRKHRTTNRAKDDGNMQILIFHMYHIGLLPGVF